MNIFHLHNDPVKAAIWQCNKHITKMLLEHCQMLCTAYHLQGIQAQYKPTHANHPTSVWIRSSYDNWLWTIEHAYATAKEYTSRYSKRHASEDVLDWCEDNVWRLGFDSSNLTKFAIAIKEDKICRTLSEFNESDPVNCYHLYYQHDKKHLHQWKQNKPDWIY